jgi:large subunit ribosomal protein L33
MAKKDARIFVWLICTTCGKQNYVTSRNKVNTPKIELKKYCNQCKAHVIHKMREKLK